MYLQEAAFRCANESCGLLAPAKQAKYRFESGGKVLSSFSIFQIYFSAGISDTYSNAKCFCNLAVENWEH